MTATDDSTDWRKLREFSGVDLNRSFVLSWDVEAETLLIDVDLFLTPKHPFYEKPRPAEKVCIRAAVIEFPICDSLQATGVNDAADLAETAASIGHGAIEHFRRRADGRYEIEGPFGIVTIDAERPILRLKNR